MKKRPFFFSPCLVTPVLQRSRPIFQVRNFSFLQINFPKPNLHFQYITKIQNLMPERRFFQAAGRVFSVFSPSLRSKNGAQYSGVCGEFLRKVMSVWAARAGVCVCACVSCLDVGDTVVSG